MKKTVPYAKKGLKAGWIAGGIVFLAGLLLFQPFTLIGIPLTIVVSVGVGWLVRIMAQGLDLDAKGAVSNQLSKVTADTGIEEVDALLSKGSDMLQTIQIEAKKLSGEPCEKTIKNLQEKSIAILQTVNTHPEKASIIRKFMNYYLPTTTKLITSYASLQKDTSANAQETKKRIAQSLQDVLSGLTTLQDKLSRDEHLELATDIDVLEQMLKRDGLTQSDLDKAVKQAQEAATVDAMITNQTIAKEIKEGIVNHTQESVAHIPQVPTMNGGTYSAQAERKQS